MAFREGSTKDYNAERAKNTVLFLSNAAKSRGLEHKIVKNLIHVWYWEGQHRALPKEYVTFGFIASTSKRSLKERQRQIPSARE